MSELQCQVLALQRNVLLLNFIAAFQSINHPKMLKCLSGSCAVLKNKTEL
ncbi:hypothetical protein Syun_007477 [Stephania yunnanensis]|uniref:Uncharacterized protein n=1 Tax=Stephania yunnanensis TaxID=152371 RepID=A0AAP0KYN7_9MAGN